MQLPDLVRPTIWRLSIRCWWGGVTTLDIVNAAYPEDALEGYERQFEQSCERVVEMQFFCPIEKLWKRLPDRDRLEAIALVMGGSV